MSERKTVRPGVRKISPVSIYGEFYGGKDLRNRCVLSLDWCMARRCLVSPVIAFSSLLSLFLFNLWRFLWQMHIIIITIIITIIVGKSHGIIASY